MVLACLVALPCAAKKRRRRAQTISLSDLRNDMRTIRGGFETEKVELTIGHGTPVPQSPSEDIAFPDVVAIGAGGQWHCSGVLIASETVITARHCLPATHVAFGHDVARPAAELAVVRSSVAEDSADLALLFLESAAPVRPRLRRPANETRPPAGLLRIVGFGANDSEGRRGFGIKRMADLPTRDWGCDERRAAALGCDPSREMVLPGSGGRDTCSGDSGGPVFERHRDTWRLVAITSRSIPGSITTCGAGGVYQRIDVMASWIDGELMAGSPKGETTP